MEKLKLSVIGFVVLLFLTGCGSNSNQMDQNKNSEQPISTPLKFSLSPDSSVPYACQEIFQQGNLYRSNHHL